jgi:hypothetical protein
VHFTLDVPGEVRVHHMGVRVYDTEGISTYLPLDVYVVPAP